MTATWEARWRAAGPFNHWLGINTLVRPVSFTRTTSETCYVPGLLVSNLIAQLSTELSMLQLTTATSHGSLPSRLTDSLPRWCPELTGPL